MTAQTDSDDLNRRLEKLVDQGKVPVFGINNLVIILAGIIVNVEN